MNLKLLNHLRHRHEDNFELHLLVLTNIIACIFSFFSIINSIILSRFKPEGINTDTGLFSCSYLVWLAIFLLSLFLAELTLHDNYYPFCRKLSLYLYSFLIIPVGLYVTASLCITSMYFIICIVILNIIATSKERLIINPFLLAVIYIYTVINFKFPELLPIVHNDNIVFIHFLIDTPIVITITALLISALTETYRSEHKKIKKQNLKLEQIIRTDILTGLYNKTFMNEQLPVLINSAYRRKSPLSVFIINIDFFKNYNSLYGNIKGDSCLIEVANILKRNCINITDQIYRFSGEEFVIAIADTDQDGARILAESIKEDFHIQQIDNYRSMICNYITVSIGIHCYSGRYSTTADKIIEKADRALYTVKRKGRDDYYIDSTTDES